MIYICSPLKANKLYTMEQNIENAKKYCEFTAKVAEGVPMCPHLYFSQFLDDSDPKDREVGIEMGLEILESSKCDEVWVFGSLVTDGMLEEIKVALKKEIPVLWYTEEMKMR